MHLMGKDVLWCFFLCYSTLDCGSSWVRQALSWSCSPLLFQLLLMEICVTWRCWWFFGLPSFWKLVLPYVSTILFSFSCSLFYGATFGLPIFRWKCFFGFSPLLMAWNWLVSVRYQLLSDANKRGPWKRIPIRFGGWKFSTGQYQRAWKWEAFPVRTGALIEVVIDCGTIYRLQKIVFYLILPHMRKSR